MTGVDQTTREIHFLGNNDITVLVSGRESGGAYCVMELVVQPHGGATALHTDRWVEVFHVRAVWDEAVRRAGVALCCKVLVAERPRRELVVSRRPHRHRPRVAAPT
jgi:hypothetical protein